MTLSSQAVVALLDAPHHLAGLSEVMARHDIKVTREGQTYLGHFPNGAARLDATADSITMLVEAPDAATLNGIKLELGGSLSFVCGRTLDISWSGGPEELTRLTKLSELTVRSSELLTPHMRRITFSGDNLERYADGSNLHMRLAFPVAGQTRPALPMVDGNGRVVWPEGAEKPILRKYTVRAVDPASSTVVIDFVLHDDAGPGSRFAASAQPGNVIAMIGPGGLTAGAADWYLLAGDETALPAIGRILERLPPKARGIALIEVADGGERQELVTEAQIEIRWLHREGAAPGTTTLLVDAVKEIEFPTDGSRVFAWAAGEFDAFKEIRSHFRKERRLPPEQHLVVSYWRRGKSGEDAEKSQD